MVPLWTVDPWILVSQAHSIDDFFPPQVPIRTAQGANALTRLALVASLAYVILSAASNTPINGWILVLIATLIAVVTMSIRTVTPAMRIPTAGAVVTSDADYYEPPPTASVWEASPNWWLNTGGPVVPSSAARVSEANGGGPQGRRETYRVPRAQPVPGQRVVQTTPSNNLVGGPGFGVGAAETSSGSPYSFSSYNTRRQIRVPPSAVREPMYLTPAQASLNASYHNPYGNPLLYEEWPTDQYTGPIAMPPDDTLERMANGTSFTNPGHIFYTLPDTTNIAGQHPWRAPAAYGTLHSQADQGYARGGMWVGRT